MKEIIQKMLTDKSARDADNAHLLANIDNKFDYWD